MIDLSGSGEVRQIGGVTAMRSPVRAAMLNSVIASNIEPAQLAETMAELRNYYGEQAWRWDVGPCSSPHDLGSRLAEAGLFHLVDAPGMAIDPKDGEWQMNPRVNEVKDEQSFNDWLDCTDVFGLPVEAKEPFRAMHRNHGWNLPMRYFYVTEEDRHAAFSMIYREGETAGIYCVATHPDFRKRGLGRMVTEQCLAAAKEMGCQSAVLQSSTMGLPVYTAIGFRETCRFGIYSSAPPK